MNQEPAFFFKTGGRTVKRWPDETVAMVRQMVAEGASIADMARATGEERTTLRGKAERYGINIPPRATPGSRLDAADAVLRREYPTNPDIHAVHALYCEAIGAHRLLDSMINRAQKIRLRRDYVSRVDVAGKAGRAYAANAEARRLARVPDIQARLDAGMPLKQIAAEVHMGRMGLQQIIAAGLAVRRPRPAPVAKPLRLPRPAAPVVLRDPPRPAKPKPQTVEEWLANGGQIKRMPTAAVCVTQATIPAADAEALRAYRAATPENGNWMQQRRAWVARNRGAQA